MQDIGQIIDTISKVLWGNTLVWVLIAVGIMLSLATGFIQLRKFFYGFSLISGKFDDPDAPGEITHAQALSASLSSIIGVSNIAGVGIAIAMGGPGALVWMWFTAVFGMAVKYCECLLSVKFRVIDANGSVGAGPMYYIEKGLGQKWLGILFAVLSAIGYLGVGNLVQSNTVAELTYKYFSIPKIATGVVMGFIVFLIIIGGVKRIARVASNIVPVMAAFYIIAALGVIIVNSSDIGLAFQVIFHDAFTGSAASGGFAGAALASTIRFGVMRAAYSNEAGWGSCPVVHGAVKTNEPVRQGIIAMLEPFVDTIIICTMTALVIILTGGYLTGESGGNLAAVSFEMAYGKIGGPIVAISTIFFALTTIITCSYYGDRSINYLFGEKFVQPYRILFCLLIPVGAITHITIAWAIGDLFSGIMIFPNLICIMFLLPVIIGTTKKYFSTPEKKRP